MDAFVLCVNELSSVCAKEIKELTGKDSKAFPGVCIVEDVSQGDLAILAYRCQTAYHVGLLLAKDASLSALESSFPSLDKGKVWDHFVSSGKTFAVSTVKMVDHEIPSPDISASFGSVIKSVDDSLVVKLSSPDIQFLVFTSEEFCGVGIDLIGFDLSKRPYKIFHHPSSLNGVFAYTVARSLGIGKESVVLDPFCSNGVIPIELALFQNSMSSFIFERKFFGLRYSFTKDAFESVEDSLKKVSVSCNNLFAYDGQLKIMLGAKKNAKIAGVLDGMECSKVSVDWLDAKFEKEVVDFIVSNPPKESKRLNNSKDIIKMYDELFYQAKFILKKDGKIGILSHRSSTVIDTSARHQFEVVSDTPLFSGKQQYFFTVFKQGSSSQEDE